MAAHGRQRLSKGKYCIFFNAPLYLEKKAISLSRNNAHLKRGNEMDALNVKAIQDGIRNKYAEVSQSAEGKFAYPTGRAGAVFLGYPPSIVESVPDEILRSFCGVGNPFSLGEIKPGEAVLDVGCGAGFDMIVARRLTGSAGRIFGIDITWKMIERARKNFAQLGIGNAEIALAGSEAIPHKAASFDVVISNGVLNLSPLKGESYKEIYSVLKENGRFQFVDIILGDGHQEQDACSIDAWSD
jgi:SAM-dependent methyltransferase